MHKVQIVPINDPSISYEIYVHPCLVTDSGSHEYDDKLIWDDGKSVSECIDGKEINLVEISTEVLNNLSGDNDYQVTSICLQFEYELKKDDKYADRNPIYIHVGLRNKSTEQPWGKHFIMLDYNVPKWYMNLLEKYEQLKEKTQKLEQDLVHEKYRPGGSGYEKAKEDFDSCKKTI